MRGSLTPAFASARAVTLAVKLAYRVCTTRPGFHSGLANLCTPPLQFWRQPPQLNCPSDSVLLLDFYAGVSKISSFRRVVFHVATEVSHLCSTVKIKSSVPNCSKASRGLFVHVQVGRIFTAISISPGNGSRQSLSRSTFRAGRNLPDKEFRYHRTVHFVIRRLGTALMVAHEVGLYHPRQSLIHYDEGGG